MSMKAMILWILLIGVVPAAQAVLNATLDIDATGSRPGVWTYDLAAARAYAKNNQKDYLIFVFGDTVGCSNCKKAKDHTFSEPEFLNAMAEKGIPLVYFDSGKAWTLPPEVNILASRYGVSSLPHVVVVKGTDGVTPWATKDADGKTATASFMYRGVYAGSDIPAPVILGEEIIYQEITATTHDTVCPAQFVRLVESFVYGLTLNDAADPADDTLAGAYPLTMLSTNQTAARTLKANDTNDWFAVTNLVGGMPYRVGMTGMTVANAAPRAFFYGDYTAATNGAAWTNIPLAALTSPYTFTAERSGTNYIRVSRPPTNNADVAYTLNYRIFEACSVGFAPASTNVTVGENATNVTVRVVRAGRLTDTAAVAYTTVNGTAEAGQDYTNVTGVLVFAPNQTNQWITVPLRYLNGQPDYGNETFMVRLAQTNDVTVLPDTAVVTLLDVDRTTDDFDTGDDVRAGAVALAMSPENGVTDLRYLSAADTNDWFVFTNMAAGVRYRVSVTDLWNENAVPQADFFFSNQSVFAGNIPLADLSTGFVFTVENAIVTNGLWLRVARTPAPNATVRYRLNYREWPKPVAGFTTNRHTVADTGRSVSLTVFRTVNTEESLTVSYQTTNGTAIAGEDYVSSQASFVFVPGQTNHTIQVQLMPDNGIWRDNRTFGVRLQVGEGGVAGITDAEVTILETDASADAYDSRPGGDGTFDVATPLLMTRVNQTVSGLLSAEDTSDWYVFTNLVNGGEYRVGVTDGVAFNALNVTASLYMTAPGGGGVVTCDWLTNNVALTVFDNVFFEVPAEVPDWDGKVWMEIKRDPGDRVHVGYTLNYREWVPCEISFETSAMTVSEASSEVSLQIRRTSFTDLTTWARITTRNGTATAGDDYVASTLTVSWQPDDPDVKTVRIPLRNYDSVWEGNETFFVTLEPDPDSAMAGAITTVEVTLVDKDAPVAGQIAFAGYGAGTNALTVKTKIAAKEGEAVTFWLVRSGGRDGAVKAVLTWTDGTVKTVVTNDVFESLEDGVKPMVVTVPERAGYQAARPVTLTLTTAIGAKAVTGKATLTVTDAAVTQTLGAYSAGDRTRVPFRSSTGAWFVTGDGDVLRCVPPAKGGSSVMQVSVTGPGVLRFKAEMFTPADGTFKVRVGSGALRDAVLAPEFDEIAVGAGAQTITWTFTRGRASLNADAYGQISEIQWIPGEGFETVGTFNGYAWMNAKNVVKSDYGLAAMTVAKDGRISGTLRFAGLAYTFTSAGYSETNAGLYRATALAKSGTQTLDLMITVNSANGCVEITDLVKFEDGLIGAVLSRNGWGDKPLSAVRDEVMSRCEGYYTMVLPDAEPEDDDVFGSGYLALTVSPNGSVKTAGKLADGTAISLSSVLMLDESGDPYAVFFTAPSAYRGGYLAMLVYFGQNGDGVTVLACAGEGGVVWVNKSPRATGEEGAGFMRYPAVIGGYYDKTKTLRDYYSGKDLSIRAIDEPSALTYTTWSGRGRSTQTTNAIAWATSEWPVTLAVNRTGTGFDVTEEGRTTERARFTMTVNRVTGLFSGAIRADYLYEPIPGRVFTTARSFVYQGVLVPERADPSDGIEGRGYFRSQEQAEAGYRFNRSYDLMINGN